MKENNILLNIPKDYGSNRLFLDNNKEGITRPNYSQLLKAQFERENTLVVSAANLLNGSAIEETEDPNYDPWGDIPEDKKEYANFYLHSKSRSETESISKKIDKNLELNKIIQSAPLIDQFTSGLVVGILDPVNFFPVGGSVLKSIRAGSISKGVANASASGFVGSAAGEAILQPQQPTRTGTESAFNIGGSTLLAGILGGAGALLKKNDFDKAAKDLVDNIDNNKVVNTPIIDSSTGSAQYVQYKDSYDQYLQNNNLSEKDFSFSEFKDSITALKGGVGGGALAKGLKFLTPSLRISNASIPEVRDYGERLFFSGMIKKKNVEGIPSAQPVEIQKLQYKANLVEAIKPSRELYKAYRKRIDSEGGEPEIKSLTQFNEEVGKAMSYNDKSHIEEVSRAAEIYRNKVANPLKDDAISANLLNEKMNVVGADTYFPRVYDLRKITKNMPEFRKILFDALDLRVGDHIGGKKDRYDFINADDRADYINEQVDNIIDSIKGGNGIEDLSNVDIIQRGVFKERKLGFISDAELEKFLNKDAEEVFSRYTDIMGSEILLSKEFGDTDLKGVLKDINRLYNDKIKGVNDAKERDVLEKERDRIIGDFKDVRDLLRGTYHSTKDPSSFFVRAGRVARQVNYARLLGGVVISSLADMVNAVSVHGFSRFSGGLKNLILNTKGIKLSAEEAKKAGNVAETIFQAKIASMADTFDPFQSKYSAFENIISNMNKTANKLFFINEWTDAVKKFSSVLTQDRMIEQIPQLLRGELKKKDVEYLSFLGIGKEEADIIASQLAKYSFKQGDVVIANTEEWDNLAAVRVFRNAMNMDVDRTILIKGVADVPLVMNTEWGKLIGQFKSFTMAATQKVLIARLQQGDSAALQGMITATSMGMMIYYLKTVSSGREVSNDWKKWVIEGVDRSGYLGAITELHNMLEASTGGVVGINNLINAEVMSRYASRKGLESLLGPSYNLFETSFYTIPSAISRDIAGKSEISESDVRSFRRMLPYQNVFYLRHAFDAMEKSLNSILETKK